MNNAKPTPNPTGQITAVAPNSAAAKLGIRAGDELLTINGHPCQDVIDVQYHSAEPSLSLQIRRDGQELTMQGVRKFNQPLGLSFKHPTFDIDIRRCNNLCEFCFVLQMAPKMRRTLYIKDDDYRYSFLFGHFVTLTNLSDHDWQRIIDQRLSPLYVSVHATELEKRRECLRNPTAPDIMGQLRALSHYGFEIHTQLVITPGVNDGPHMIRSIEDLASLHPTVQSISVVPVGLTKFHKYGLQTGSVEHAQEVLSVCHAYQERLRPQLGVGFVYPTDEWYLVSNQPMPALASYDGLALHENGLGMVRSFLDEWLTIQQEELPTFRPLAARVTLVTASLFGPTLRQAAQELAARSGVVVDVQVVENKGLGEGITVAGLLFGGDVIAHLTALRDADALGDVVVLPRIMFDHPEGIALDDVSPLDVAKALNRPVALADWMGDVLDAAQGKNALTFTPNLMPTDMPVVREGGWAVEKYL
jgi:putative radical SAM enzyme (TIGR03279 family)